MDLTPKQKRTLEFIRRDIEKKGRAPTLREIQDLLGSTSISSAQNMVKALSEKGYIETSEWSATRGIELTKMGRAFGRKPAFELDAEQWAIPCLGSVPAGNPLEAIGEQIGVLSLTPAMLPRPRARQDQLFAVRAVGDSMVGAGIIDGDWLVVRHQETAEVGDIVIARVEGEATVKRFAQDKFGGVFLQPENDAYQPINKAFELVGKVLHLSRSF